MPMLESFPFIINTLVGIRYLVPQMVSWFVSDAGFAIDMHRSSSTLRRTTSIQTLRTDRAR